MLQRGNKCKSHIAQSLSEYSIKHIFKPGQNTKVITLQVFQLSQSMPSEGVSRTSKTALVQSHHNSSREHQIQEQTEATPGGISSALGKCQLYKKAGFTEKSVNWQPAQGPDKQLLLVSRYVLHEQLFQDGLWHHIQENCFRGFHEGIHEGLETMQMLSGPGDIPFACQCTHLGVPNTYILEQHSPGCCLHNRWEVYFLHSAACLIASVASQIL